MSKLKAKTFKKSKNLNRPKSRKELRKESRKLKKQKKLEYYTNRKKGGKAEESTSLVKKSSNKGFKSQNQTENKVTQNKSEIKINSKKTIQDDRFKEIQTERRKQEKLKKEMLKQRNKQLQDANVEEDRNIKRLEKQLKLNKRKTKAIPKSFVSEGLDYLLEVCDGDMKNAISAEQQFKEANDDFEEDFELMLGKKIKKQKTKEEESYDNFSDLEGDLEGSEEDDEEEEESINNDRSDDEANELLDDESNNFENQSDHHSSSEDEEEYSDEENDDEENDDLENDDENEEKDFIKDEEMDSKISDEELDASNNEEDASNDEELDAFNDEELDVSNDEELNISNDEELDASNDEESKSSNNNKKIKNHEDGTWEDIYGRLRNKDGSIITNQNQDKTANYKYIPPALRLENSSNDHQRKERLARLKKQLKGLLNRLAEANMHSISNQVEELYMANSRNDMNDTITNLMIESLASSVFTPERLLLEHVMLISILHANVGTEVGAHFLQEIIKLFNHLFNTPQEVEDKTLDNVIIIIAQLYNFKVFDARLLYDILQKLSKKFDEKSVECILLILKNVGFSLRKDDPLALKSLILDLQKQAANVTDEVKENPRIKFMLDILLAIKNNNVSKIPNYDSTYSEHLKKILKGFIRKGNYITQLKISLDDLLKAETRGKWWIVGSAWTGNIDNDNISKPLQKSVFSQKLLNLAKKHHMNTDARRNIFCIIMSAEDYLDAFEKLLRLGLKNQQEREIIHVILHCCLQEKNFNPYYAILAQKFCDHDRKFQMTIKFSVWDKLKALGECSANQLSNLAKMLTHLFLEKGLPISTLKIVEFCELDKTTLRFLRQVLLGILLTEDTESCVQVFEKVSHSDKLKMFRESLRLFIHHFLLKNLSTSQIVGEEHKNLLKERTGMIEKILSVSDKKMRF